MKRRRPPRACRHGRHKTRFYYFVSPSGLWSELPAGTRCVRCHQRNVWNKDRPLGLHAALAKLSKRAERERHEHFIRSLANARAPARRTSVLLLR